MFLIYHENLRNASAHNYRLCRRLKKLLKGKAKQLSNKYYILYRYIYINHVVWFDLSDWLYCTSQSESESVAAKGQRHQPFFTNKNCIKGSENKSRAPFTLPYNIFVPIPITKNRVLRSRRSIFSAAALGVSDHRFVGKKTTNPLASIFLP